ncbi:MAG: hypothetical protein IJ711_12195 [Lachnospiraceae bacterium]|nr:hypothetical protein [Lachnospiraceae bacterium]
MGRSAARDGIFSIADFMSDLENLHNAARFYIALEAICFANNEPAYEMYQTGRHFHGLPYFERYKLNMEIPYIDLSAANGDLLEEMKLGNKYLAEHPLE